MTHTIGRLLAAIAFVTMCAGRVSAQAAAADAPATRGSVTVNASASNRTQRANAVPGLEVGGDIRHITERFDGDVEYSSFAARVNETYSHAWRVGAGADARVYLFTEAVEIVPAFQSSDGVSATGALQARGIMTLQ